MRRWCSLFWVVSIVLVSATAFAQMPTTVKNSLIREENPKGAKERLIIPYAFSSETMGLTFGIGGMAKGYGQDQLVVAGSAYVGSNNEVAVEKDAASVIAGMWDLVCHESKKVLLVTVGKMEEGPPATTSRSSCQTTVSCVD